MFSSRGCSDPPPSPPGEQILGKKHTHTHTKKKICTYVSGPRDRRVPLHPGLKGAVDREVPHVRFCLVPLSLLRHIPVQVSEPLSLAFVVPPVVDAIIQEVQVAFRVPISHCLRAVVPVVATSTYRRFGIQQPPPGRRIIHVRVRARLSYPGKPHFQVVVKVCQHGFGCGSKHLRAVHFAEGLVRPKRAFVAEIAARNPAVGACLSTARGGSKPIVVHDERVDRVPSECDDVIRRAAVRINRSIRLPSRENTDGVLRTPSVFSSRFSVKPNEMIYVRPISERVHVPFNFVH